MKYIYKRRKTCFLGNFWRFMGIFCHFLLIFGHFCDREHIIYLNLTRSGTGISFQNGFYCRFSRFLQFVMLFSTIFRAFSDFFIDNILFTLILHDREAVFHYIRLEMVRNMFLFIFGDFVCHFWPFL